MVVFQIVTATSLDGLLLFGHAIRGLAGFPEIEAEAFGLREARLAVTVLRAFGLGPGKHAVAAPDLRTLLLAAALPLGDLLLDVDGGVAGEGPGNSPSSWGMHSKGKRLFSEHPSSLLLSLALSRSRSRSLSVSLSFSRSLSPDGTVRTEVCSGVVLDQFGGLQASHISPFSSTPVCHPDIFIASLAPSTVGILRETRTQTGLFSAGKGEAQR